ncbi:ABC-type dipeptide/oligopeptide/nickel transport system ATP-binding protein (DppD/OppD) [Acholeplasma hippikon]|uniref:ABC-type dipeptide/oligopeptide/nickel transport system ATP-binding protein (DppD/OppD) n=2 Tax=Acholeplasma hippikon TaxID=264636 RepID=A0A449BL48_9MOLU|nr:ABC transporter ATP-binding protein [Acholeplasma hippikon]VEU83169.1 ABC-type dipeptide/oligopeptide/nickel transport system ATP-binding protein (DppD/OppD) [Acholeplasma hippikon]
MNKKEVVIQVKDLSVSFRTNAGMVQAVRGVSYELYKGETLAIVGESGSGKSVTSRSIMGILAGNAVVNHGEIHYEGRDLLKLPEEEFHKIRGRKIGMIFQDPTSALNPIMRVGKQITEAMILNGKRKENKIKELYNAEEVAYTNAILRLNEIKADASFDKATKKAEIAKIKAVISETKVKLIEAKKKAKETIEEEYVQYKEQYLKEKELYISTFKNGKAELQAKLAASQKGTPQYIEILKQLRNEYSTARYRRELFLIKDAYLRKIKVTHYEAKLEAYKIMKEVGIPEPEKRFKMYPFQFSGGMKQRIVIAIALMAQPEILICDEPTTALDVTIQAQILELIKDIKKRRNLSVVFITHNLGVVANIADRVAVMYAGKIVEYGTLDDVFYDPKHPYTWALMSSMPDINSKDKLQTIPGTPPNMLFPPKGDAFAQRNKYAMAIDFEEQPPMFKVSETHYAATWLLHPDAPKLEMPDVIKERIVAMKEEIKRLGGK